MGLAAHPKMFRGANKLTLDVKGRMVMPTRYRERLQELCDAHRPVWPTKLLGRIFAAGGNNMTTWPRQYFSFAVE